MNFDSQTLNLTIAGRDRLVTIDGSLIKTLWSAFEGPQTPEGIVDLHRDLWPKVAADQIERGTADATSGGPIVLTSADWEA